MSESKLHHTSPLGWLLLRDGHAVPLSGLAPDALKRAAKGTILRPETDLRHNARLHAIVDALGFRGDFGDFTHRGWPDFQSFLADNGCTAQRSLFVRNGGHYSLRIRPADLGRRSLADRIFFGPQPAPGRVFLGYGVDWNAWDDRAEEVHPRPYNPGAPSFVPVERGQAIDWLLSRRLDFEGQWGFIDDKLVSVEELPLVDKTYFPDPTSAADERRRSLQRLQVAIRAFRFVIEGHSEGWVDVLPVNEALVVLRGEDGAWDLLWRDLREAAPPTDADESMAAYGLKVDDRPSSLMGDRDLAPRLYFRRGVWDEREEHDAEQHFYDRGGDPASRRLLGGDEVRQIYLVDRGAWPKPARSRWIGAVPDGFRCVNLDGRRCFVSDLVTVGEFRRMLDDTGYLERRAEHADPWERANDGDALSAPVGVTWSDAQAFCAWKERELKVVVRLLRLREHRALRPFFSKHYEALARLDFPWESFPPRPLVDASTPDEPVPVPSAVEWSEPRFLSAGPDRPEFPDASGVSTWSRKRWIVEFPPRASWSSSLPWREHAGLRFIDAWDAYEWCQEDAWMAGRFWEGPIGSASWGAYKNVKIGFRLVLDVEPA